MAATDSQITCKVLVLGDPATGKTSLIKRTVGNSFTDLHKPTVGVDFHFKRVTCNDDNVTLQLWDLAGQDRFGAIYRVYYSGAFGALLVFDLSAPDTFKSVSNWKREIDSKCKLPDGSPLPVLLVGNKDDLPDAAYDKGQLDEYCQSNGFIGWTVTSAKTNHNVEHTMDTLVQHMMQHDAAFVEQRKAKEEAAALSVNLAEPKGSDSGCC